MDSLPAEGPMHQWRGAAADCPLPKWPASGVTSLSGCAEEGLEHLKKQYNLQESFTASYEKVVDEVSEALQATSAANRSALALLQGKYASERAHRKSSWAFQSHHDMLDAAVWWACDADWGVIHVAAVLAGRCRRCRRG